MNRSSVLRVGLECQRYDSFEFGVVMAAGVVLCSRCWALWCRICLKRHFRHDEGRIEVRKEAIAKSSIWIQSGRVVEVEKLSDGLSQHVMSFSLLEVSAFIF